MLEGQGNGHLGHDREAGLARRLDRLGKLRLVDECLKHEGIAATVRQQATLLSIRAPALPVRELYIMKRPHRSGHKTFRSRGFAGEANAFRICPPHQLRRHSQAVGREGVGSDHFGACGDVLAMHLKDEVRILQIEQRQVLPLLRPSGEELRAHRAVPEDDALFQGL